MRFSISKNELLNALTIVQKGVSTRTTIPVLSGVLLRTQQDSIVFQTTQGDELSIKYSAPALIEEEGSIVVPCKLFFEIVKNFNDAAVHFSLESNCAKIECDTSSLMIKTISAEDFPEFPQVNATKSVSLKFNDFAAMVKKVARVTSKDNTHMALTGVLVTTEGSAIRMVATDTYRLAMAETSLSVAPVEPFKALISGTFLLDLAALPKSEEDITISISDNQVLVLYQNTVFINRRISGNFPNYKQLLQANHTTIIQLKTDDLISSVRRTALIGNIGSSVKLSSNPEAGTVVLTSKAQDIGSIEDTLASKGIGQAIEISFGCNYLLDGLGAITGENVTLKLQGSMKPGIITEENSTEYTYLIMPVRI